MKSLLNIALAAALLAPAPALAASATPSATPSAATQKEFAAFIAKFRAALKANDAAAIAGMTKYPFMDARNGQYFTVRNAEQFRAQSYARNFTPKNRACVLKNKAVYDRVDAGDGYYSIFCGALMFTFVKTPKGFLFENIGAND
ncbi:MAG: hypothetical protein LBV50_10540 [Novosphingobium sp.]|jgi:hypothetical protein|nr:hypothetical protein [Novosphingobium sp.]